MNNIKQAINKITINKERIIKQIISNDLQIKQLLKKEFIN